MCANGQECRKREATTRITTTTEKKIKQNIIRTKHDSAMRYTNNMCNFRGVGVEMFYTMWPNNNATNEEREKKKSNDQRKTAFRIQRIRIIIQIFYQEFFGIAK